MKADITRRTFDPARHFTAVVFGQGQVQVDADLNEQEEIARYRTATLAADAVGATGVPKAAGGFAVTLSPDRRDLLLSPGRIWVDGILCENDPRPVAATVTSATEVRPALSTPDGRPFAAEQWVEVPVGAPPVRIASVTAQGGLVLAAAPAGLTVGGTVQIRRVTSFGCQPDRYVGPPLAAGPLAAGAYRVECDVWQQHVGQVEEPSIGDAALGDAEVATRSRVVWQLRLVPAGPVGGGTGTVDPTPAPARLRASTVPGLPADNPCELPDEAGFRGLAHQLYRVECQERTATEVTLKWQRNNAFLVSEVTDLGSTVTLRDMGRDDDLGFTAAAYLELTDDALEAEQAPSDLLAVLLPDRDTRTVKLAGTPSRAQPAHRVRARRWDGVLRIPLGAADTGADRVLEHGLQVAFEPGELRPGDYWLIPARSADHGGGTIEWPVDSAGRPLPKAPDGIVHHRAGLAVVDCDGATFVAVRDHRPMFPALTALTAADVSVDPTVCGFTAAKTVQQALDELCGRAGGLYTAVASPGPGWEKVFDRIPAGADAKIGFPVGGYPVTGPVTVAGRGHLVLEGTGPGSAITGAAGIETLLAFTGCASVRLRDLSFTAAAVPSDVPGINGALSFADCRQVEVDAVTVSTAYAETARSACVRVTGARTTVRVAGSRFNVGHRQVGVLLTDVATAVVADNTFAPVPASGLPPRPTKLERAAIRRTLFGDLRAVGAGKRRIPVTVAGNPLSFASSGPGGAVWPELLRGNTFASMGQLQKHVDRVLRGVFTDTPVAGSEQLAAFVRDRIVAARGTVIGQGIVVAGQTGTDVRIERNTIGAVLQGVHLAASHRTGPGAAPDALDRVVVTDNRIDVLVPPATVRGKHGIFVGNARAVRIDDNDLRFDSRFPDDRIRPDGIRVHGHIGRQLLIRSNVLSGFPGGISVTGRSATAGTADPARLWLATDNVLAGAASPWIRTAGELGSQLVFRGNRPGPA